MMWQRSADHRQKQEPGGVTITQGLDATRPITEALLDRLADHAERRNAGLAQLDLCPAAPLAQP